MSADVLENSFDTTGESQAVQDMVAWFLTEHEDPAENCPWQEGEYKYIWGGPVFAEEAIPAKYEGTVSPVDLARAIEILGEGCEWSKVPPEDQDEEPDEDDEPEEDPERESES